MNQYWHLMTMANCVMLPPNSVVFTYLNLHLRRCCLLGHTEEGKFSQFCLKVQSVYWYPFIYLVPFTNLSKSMMCGYLADL